MVITFDPERLARYEKAGWEAYYDRNWPRAFVLLVRLNRAQFRMRWPLALAAALDTVRASLAFAPHDNDVPKAQRLLARFYAKARRTMKMQADAATLAACELDYWVVHRQLAQRRLADPADNDLTPLVAALARLHAALFDATPEQMRRSAELRALAAVAVDRITGGSSADVAADWRAVETYLQAAYRAVLEALGQADAATATNDYHFVTHWRVQGTVAEVALLLGDAPDLVRWWPSVYLDVQERVPGDAQGVGKVISLHTRGWLPYTLRWEFRVTAVRADGFALEAWGDFVGRGVWTFAQAGASVNITYDWKIRADKPLLRYGSVLFKPIFAANHHWAMRRGEQSLRLELARRRAFLEAARARIPAPPGPARAATALLLAGVAALCGALYALRQLKKTSARP